MSKSSQNQDRPKRMKIAEKDKQKERKRLSRDLPLGKVAGQGISPRDLVARLDD